LVPICGWLFWLARQRGGQHRCNTGLKIAAGLVAALMVFSFLLGILGLNLASLGDMAQDGGLLGRLTANFSNWGSLFSGLQGGQAATDILAGAFGRRILMPGTWITLLLVLAGTWALLASYLPARKAQMAAPVEPENLLAGADGPLHREEEIMEGQNVPASLADPHGFVLLLVLVGVGLTLVPEFVYLRDQFGGRMNTIFKFYFETWIVWGLAASFAFAILWKELKSLPALIAKVGLGLALLAGLAYPFFGLSQRLDFSRASEWTLDGTASLARYDAGEKGAMDWLAQAPYGTIVEAVGGSYGPAARMATHSGLPNVLGWPGHESQWRGGALEMGNRQDDISRLYRTRDWLEAKTILARYHVRYVVVGGLELSTYRTDEKAGLRALDETKFQKNLKVAYQNLGITIYEVPAYDLPDEKES
jgi:hypothetical protein